MVPKKTETTYEYLFTLRFTPTSEGYLVTCRALPGFAIEGDTFAEAHARAVNTIRNCILHLRKEGIEFPSDQLIEREPVEKQIRIAVPAG